MGLLQVLQDLRRALRRLLWEVSHSFPISAVMCFWSVWKGEVVNMVEVLTDKCVELWECLRFDPYSNDC